MPEEDGLDAQDDAAAHAAAHAEADAEAHAAADLVVQSEGVDAYGVIGNPIAHSRSPSIHAAFALATGQAIVYERILAPADGFVAIVDAFRAQGGRGLNITLPFKQDAYAYATERTPRAEAAGAVNTLVFGADGVSVSYTHLTLPTKRIV